MSKKTTTIFVIIMSLFALAPVMSANASNNAPTEGKAELDSCNGKSDGDICSFTKDDKTVNGTCQRSDDGKTICVEKK